jgi:hypothetical protein
MTEEGPTGPQAGPYPPPEDVPELTDRDRAYASVYVQLLDATAAGANWRTIARDVLKFDPSADAETAKVIFDQFHARAIWMTRVGYKLLLKSGR